MSKDKELTAKEIADKFTMLIADPRECERQIDLLISQKCKEQREICANEIEDEKHTGFKLLIATIKKLIRNAPEPPK